MLLPPPGNPRILVFATLVNTFGNGAYLTVGTLFLTRSVGLTAAQLALGLSIAAVVGMALTTPLGYAADRYGPKEVQIGALAALALCYSGLTLVSGPASFTVLAALIAIGESCVKSANGAMVAGAVPPEQRLRLRAYLRSTNNAGIALGTLAGSLPLLWDTRTGYVALLLANASTFLIAAAIVSRADRVAPLPRPDTGPRLVALRDRPFLAYSLIDGLMASLYNGILGLALPLWLVAATDAPLWLVSASLLVNTIGCVTLQVWAARGADTPASAIRAGRRGALVVGGACLLLGLTADLPTWAVIALVLTAAAVHVAGELWLSTATWSVVYGLAPEWAHGQYQATYFTGRQIGNGITPPLLAVLVIVGGLLGWTGLAAIFVAGGLAYPAVVRWGIRTRPPAAPAAVPAMAGAPAPS